MSELNDEYAHTVASMRTCCPAARLPPPTVETFRRSFDSSTWNVPEVPSAQVALIVLGWLGSGPLVERPSSSDAPESHEMPTVAHLGALRTESYAAVCAPPPVPVMVKVMLASRVVAPLVPRAWKVDVPAAVPAATETVSVELTLPLAGGVTDAGAYAQLTPAGAPAQDSDTALLNPLVDVTVQVLVALPPAAADRLAGEHVTAKSGVGGPPTSRPTAYASTESAAPPPSLRLSV